MNCFDKSPFGIHSETLSYICVSLKLNSKQLWVLHLTQGAFNIIGNVESPNVECPLQSCWMSLDPPSQEPRPPLSPPRLPWRSTSCSPSPAYFSHSSVRQRRQKHRILELFHNKIIFPQPICAPKGTNDSVHLKKTPTSYEFFWTSNFWHFTMKTSYPWTLKRGFVLELV